MAKMIASINIGSAVQSQLLMALIRKVSHLSCGAQGHRAVTAY